jgi:hypothetical protein
VSRQTLSRHVAPNGSLRPDCQRLLRSPQAIGRQDRLKGIVMDNLLTVAFEAHHTGKNHRGYKVTVGRDLFR